MAWLTVETFVVTTKPVDAYGGIRIPAEEIYKIADQLRLHGTARMKGHHDARFPIRVQSIEVEVRPIGGDDLGVWMSAVVDEDDWNRIGGTRGFSIAVTEALEEVGLTLPEIQVHADASWFADDEIAEAVEILRRDYRTHGSRLYQFSMWPPAKIVIEAGWSLVMALGPNLAASAVYDALKLLILKKRARGQARSFGEPTIIDMKIRNGPKEATAVIRTDDPETLRIAMTTFSNAVDRIVSADSTDRGGAVWFDSESQEWRIVE